MNTWKILQGDAIEQLNLLPAESVHTCVTSPPYWGLRNYGVEGQLGLEKTPEEYIAKMVQVFAGVKRVLRDDGTLFLNIGDSYWGGKGQSSQAWSTANTDRGVIQGPQHQICGKGETRPSDGKHPTIKPKDLVGIPWMLAFALRADGWYLRSDIIWSKPNPMPESVTDRPTKSHEYLFLLAKSADYFFDQEAVKEPATHAGKVVKTKGNDGMDAGYDGNRTRDGFRRGVTVGSHRNLRSVWTIATQPYKGSHFATFPEKLVEPCIKAGTSEKGVCGSCGAPWERMVKASRTFQSGSGRSGRDPTGKNGGGLQGGGETRDVRRGPVVSNETLGWKPTCSCNSEVVPATVLDPFCGSGTTGAVSLRHGRNFIGIELNADYIKLAEKRIGAVDPLFNLGM